MQISCNPTYSGTHEVLIKYLRDRYNVEVTLVGRSIDEYRKAVKLNTKVSKPTVQCVLCCKESTRYRRR